MIKDENGIPVYVKHVGDKNIVMLCRGKYIEWSL